MDRNPVALQGMGWHPWSWKLGRLADAAMRAFGGLARKLKYPALATVPVSAAMLSRMATMSPEQPLEEAAQLLVSGRLAQLPIVDHGRLVGVVTRDGVAAALQTAGPHAPVTAAPLRHVVPVAPGDALSDVLVRLRALPDAVAVVLDHGGPVGLLTAEHLAAYLAHVPDAVG